MNHALPSRPANRNRASLGVVSRVAAAVFGGYALAASSATFLAVFLPVTTVEATVAGTLLSIVVYICAAMWAFGARTAWHGWAGVLGAAVLLMGLVLITGKAA